MKPLNIGILGCANIAGRLVIPALRTMDEFNLIAVASRSKEKADTFAQRFGCEGVVGYQNLLKRADIDAVYVPLPVGLHYEWVIKALQHYKHVLVEKSIAEHYDAVKEMVTLAQQHNLVLIENFMFLYHSQHKFVFDMLERGEIGAIRCFRSSFGFPPLPPNNIRYQKALGGGALLDAGAYTIKAAQFILKTPLTVKAAFLHTDGAYEVDTTGGAFLTGENGVFAEVAFGFDNFYQCNYEIWGSHGKLTSERAFTAGPNFKPKIVLEKQDERHEYQLAPDNHFVNIFREFATAIHTGDVAHHYQGILDHANLMQEVREHACQTG